ncbi:hypothetical protein [Cryobacterium tagatosivorans]|uniref:hypothetical protein n=1 Tax=Cryobacterium tagatosivorans TaxID=1259199 RepID=UPI00141AF95C|nr:hypothetical protein [Cryobacterium tagatosivorans]
MIMLIALGILALAGIMGTVHRLVRDTPGRVATRGATRVASALTRSRDHELLAFAPR